MLRIAVQVQRAAGRNEVIIRLDRVRETGPQLKGTRIEHEQAAQAVTTGGTQADNRGSQRSNGQRARAGLNQRDH